MDTACCKTSCCKTSIAEDLGKLVLRITIGGLMLFHGVGKIQGGVEGISQILDGHNLPKILAYGAYVGEVVAPLLIVVGLFARPAALIVAFNMAVAVYLAHREQLMTLGAGGGYALELQAFYFLGALAIVFLGSGRIGFTRRRKPAAEEPAAE